MDANAFPSDLSDEDLDALDGTGDAGDPDNGAEDDDDSSLYAKLVTRGVDPDFAKKLGSSFVPKSEYQRAVAQQREAESQVRAMFDKVMSGGGGMSAKGSTPEEDLDAVKRALVEQGPQGAALAKLFDVYANDIQKRTDAKYAPALQKAYEREVESYLSERKAALTEKAGEGINKLWPQVSALARQHQVDPEQVLLWPQFADKYRAMLGRTFLNQQRKSRETAQRNSMDGASARRSSPPLQGDSADYRGVERKPKEMTLDERVNRAMQRAFR